ncbi:DUF2779 domain-containing protein [Spiroplasma platyhelix]|uniref:DUF2779 domain-containing protein n=1 Tax=Spiroplasma platyhelix PALS-1 TaxID=1276218 RepID=A0A846TXF4_9MOLU|nr:DUF2779 domain-containing protein [Spiroplasma platyhelix]MBE4704379.1 hypothetical protein [Spiroplasma platyhelix PALS-1]NKE38751.1 DUF2779 domain-containing protein [Spiroplasma platyhelix PALS-1]UJB28962.1 hypothetical protein SPLAT_v1c01970 [Spiroplasma platyhelix PALS-1]
MKIYKDDYKHFRTCQKLAWFLSEKHYHLAKKLIDDKLIVNFIELTNTKTSSKINGFEAKFETEEQIRTVTDLDYLNFEDQEFQEEVSDDFYAGETIADGLETGHYAQEYFMQDYQCFNFETQQTNNQSEILNDKKYQVFFEPRFEYNSCVTKCDILKRNGSGWDLIEVKAVTWVKEEHMWDLLYQYDILTKCGLDIVNVYIMYLNNDYIRKEKLDLKALFIANGSTWQKSNKTKKSFSLYQSIQEELVDHHLAQEYQTIADILAIADEQEALKLLTNKYCDAKQQQYCFHIFNYFDRYNTIFELYRLRKKKKAFWYYEHDLLSLQDERLLTFVVDSKLHYRQYQIANHGEQVINLSYLNQLKSELSKYQYPVYMYDFETMKSAIPKFINSKSYQQIPFQYSVHVLLGPDFDFKTNQNIKHYQFLADGTNDPRKEVVSHLCHDLIAIHGLGTYVAYNQSFEKSVLKKLMFNFKDYYHELEKIFNRTIDLQDFFKDFKIYKSSFAGSLSIKKTLPAFDSNFSYQDLAIQKGDMASEVFRRRVENNISLKNWQENFYQNMLDYCTRDTLGMVVLFWHIKHLIENNQEIK